MTLNIPPIVFGLTWIILYILQATAAMQRQFNIDNVGYEWSTSLTLFVVALFTGMSFMPLFFMLESFLLGFLALISSWALYFAAMILFFQEHIVSGWLMLPTLVWLSFVVLYYINIWYVTIMEQKPFFTMK